MSAAKDRLQVAIDAYRAKQGDGLDQHAKDVLNRLAADGRAADALVAALPNGDYWDVQGPVSLPKWRIFERARR
jgi:hypothetical protein